MASLLFTIVRVYETRDDTSNETQRDAPNLSTRHGRKSQETRNGGKYGKPAEDIYGG